MKDNIEVSTLRKDSVKVGDRITYYTFPIAYKGKIYLFSSPDGTPLDIVKTLEDIDAGRILASGDFEAGVRLVPEVYALQDSAEQAQRITKTLAEVRER
jgi:hypothetical protein